MEVSGAAELVSEATRRLMDAGTLQRPVISSACPAVVRLIRVRFPDLCDHVLPLLSPMESCGKDCKSSRPCRKQACRKSRSAAFSSRRALQRLRIFACPSASKIGGRRRYRHQRNFSRSFQAAWIKLTPKDLESLSNSGIIGVSWATSGGESSALLKEKYLAADGIENVIRVLEEIEDERIGELDFIELNACSGGCVGGVLCVENPYVAIARLQRLRKYLPSRRIAEKTKPSRRNELGQRAGVSNV